MLHTYLIASSQGFRVGRAAGNGVCRGVSSRRQRPGRLQRLHLRLRPGRPCPRSSKPHTRRTLSKLVSSSVTRPPPAIITWGRPDVRELQSNLGPQSAKTIIIYCLALARGRNWSNKTDTIKLSPNQQQPDSTLNTLAVRVGYIVLYRQSVRERTATFRPVPVRRIR